jgi:hypothetical protein
VPGDSQRMHTGLCPSSFVCEAWTRVRNRDSACAEHKFKVMQLPVADSGLDGKHKTAAYGLHEAVSLIGPPH